jgi:hypothetical protein
MTSLLLLASLAGAAKNVNLRAGPPASLSEQTSTSTDKLPESLTQLAAKSAAKMKLCFPAGSLVRLGDGSTKKIEDLGTGDILETSANLKDISKDDPWLFDWHSHTGARQQAVDETYLEVAHEAGTLRISANHLLFARKPQDDTAAVLLAEQLAVGDELLLRDTFPGLPDRSQLSPSKVINIKEVQAPGVYAPVTSSGRLVVNDVLVSSYAVTPAWPSLVKAFKVLTSSKQRTFLETQAHAFLAPLRKRYEHGEVPSNVHNVLTPDDRKGLKGVDAFISGFLAQAGIDVSDEFLA